MNGILGLILTAALAASAAAADMARDVSHTLPDAPTRNQSDAGSCHSFAATGLVESALYRQYGVRLRLSEADLFVGRIVTDKDRKSTRLNSSHIQKSRMPSSA